MIIPPQVLHRLWSGGTIGAVLKPLHAGNRAWLHIIPRTEVVAPVDRERLTRDLSAHTIGFPPRCVVTGYKLVRLEVSEETLERLRGDDDLREGELLREEKMAHSDAELERVILNWLDDMSQLRHHSSVTDLFLMRDQMW